MATAPRTPAKGRAQRASNVVLDLDTLEREQTYEPMTVRVSGQVVTLIDPAELDWQVLATLSETRPFEFFDNVIPEDEREAFFAAKFPGWKMQEMIQKYRAHYGLTDQGN